MPMRPPSSADMAMGEPWPSSARSWSPRRRMSSKASETVVEARSPILSSCLPMWSPAWPPSTRKAEIPFEPRPGEVRAQTMITPARSPEVIHCFSPFITQAPPSCRQVETSKAETEPHEGKEAAMQRNMKGGKIALSQRQYHELDASHEKENVSQ